MFRRFDTRVVAAVLAALGNPHFRPPEPGVNRTDAGETATFMKRLEYVLSRTYDRKYPDLKARLFLPVNSEVPSGAESFTIRAYDYAGTARVISNFADDLPLVDVIAGERSQLLKSIGDGYVYSVQDLRASAMAGTQLDVKRGQAARRVIENTIEQIAAKGNSAAGLPGFVNNPNVTILSAPGDITGNWPAATPQEMLEDLNTIVRTMVVDTKEVWKPDTLLLPTARFELINSTMMQAGVDTRTVLRVFLENQTHIRNVDSWSQLDLADSAGTGPRAIAYCRNPECLELVISQDFEQFPPQSVNLAFKVPCHARVGGVVIYYFLSVIYADGI